MPQETARSIVAGDEAILARRYAGALYDLAGEQKQVDAVAADLGMLRTLQQESAEFRFIVSRSCLTRKQLVTIIQEVAAAAKFNTLTSRFLGYVARNRRLGLLGSMIDAFMAVRAAQRGEFTADISSTHALSSSQEEQLAAKLGAWMGGKVHLSVRKDPGLLGGLVVRIGSRLIDASVKTRLARLERQLKTG